VDGGPQSCRAGRPGTPLRGRENGNGVYGVHDGREVIARFETPEEAVALVVATLPEGLGPAR
ncbi:DUF6193 family natural product biosynthesis protein, partial [Kitasatospora cinereorecta]